jgi:nucleoside-diphosphate-sugar epimerase
MQEHRSRLLPLISFLCDHRRMSEANRPAGNAKDQAGGASRPPSVPRTARGRAWHVPSNEPRSQRQAVSDFARAAGVGEVRVGEIPRVVVRGMGLVWPLMRELRETEYQFRDDFVMDSSAAEATFGLKPTPWAEIVAATVSR